MKISSTKKSLLEKTKRRLLAIVASLLYVLSAGHPVLADDTEVFFGLGNQANVLFIIDTSGSMGRVDDSSVDSRSRLEIVQSVFSDLMQNPNYLGFNVALMRFDSTPGNTLGGYFISPMQELTATSRNNIIAAANALQPGRSTPLSETLYEAALFWGGMAVDFGDSSSPATNVSGVASPDGNYISPITSQCQKNFTILLTDGAPSSNDTDANTKIAALTGNSCDGNCLDEVAGYLYTTDQNTSIPNAPDPQVVETFTIGFTTNQTLLEATAMAGGGTALPGGGNDHYFTARSANELTTAFANALGDIVNTNEASFSPPALAANTFNGISHYNKLYFSLFKPAATPKWDGNVKPYAFNNDNHLVGIDGNLAINNNGGFTTDSRSFWSANVDAGNAIAGGANDRLPTAANRTLYTYTGTYSNATGIPYSTLSLLNDANTSLTTNLLGLPSGSADRSAIISYARNLKLGAPLHSQPALVTYGGSTAATADLTLFVATNNGFLHALNASPEDDGTSEGGKELFAFIPQELLPNLPSLKSETGAMVYGLDGNISVWRHDANNDNTITRADGDHVFVYVGQRRGGKDYYALDVTDRSAPVLKWVIRGGGGINGTTGFDELGQSWSTPKLTTIKYASTSKKVLIFGGGYDPAQDANPFNADDTSGRAVFIVDADTGALLWSAGSGTFSNSIPSDVALLDSNLDGTTDRLYVGDMRGQVFRIDLQATTSGVSGTTTRIANLGSAQTSATAADNRRFYNAPDVVVTQRRGSAPYVSINIGSGYRAHPLNPTNPNGSAAPRVNDRFYSLRDHNVVGPIPTGTSVTTITDDDLFDTTSVAVLNNAQTTRLSADTANGWYITLGGGNGEKVLAPAFTINSEIFFTTYTPPALAGAPSCIARSGTGRLYRVSLFDASPVVDQNGDNDTSDITDRFDDLHTPGIPSAPSAMFRKNSAGNIKIMTCVGTSCEPLPNAIQMQKTYWRDGS